VVGHFFADDDGLVLSSSSIRLGEEGSASSVLLLRDSTDLQRHGGASSMGEEVLV
jgi:hypothetical protein